MTRYSIDRSSRFLKRLADTVSAVDRCAECGFAHDALARDQIAEALLMVAAQYRPRLSGGQPNRRPSPVTWSPIEYGVHVRDLLLVQRERIALALRFDRPTFPSTAPDPRTADDRYVDQDPSRIVEQLEAATSSLASLLEELSDAEWSRVGIYDSPHPAERSVTWIGRDTVHELAHHLLDIARSTDPASAPASG